MATLEERYNSSIPILAGLGRTNAEGVPLGSGVIEKVSPDLYRIICEACFGYLWNQPNLTFEQTQPGGYVGSGCAETGQQSKRASL